MNIFNTKLITLIFFFLILNNTSSQILPGANSIAQAHSDIAISKDIFSLFNNPAGVSIKNKREIGIFYSPSPYGIKELSNGFAAYREPTSFGNIAIGVMTYGFDLYNENEFVFGYSNEITENILWGISFSQLITKIKRYGSTSAFNFSFGSIFRFSKDISLGFYAKNILRSANNLNRDILFSSGISYSPLKNSTINLAVSKELDYPFSISAGCNYALVKFLHLRFGLRRDPNQYSGGLGIYFSVFNLNYAASSHIDLGLTHQFDLIISL